ncbi:hypothetical protein F5Y18DRAFT_2859 [Xylariaceae sp. FL1019]|nr:hypothetical protein F5Y18DRAFT_2859 [Xylariaceae sp. FL1019]
MASSSVNPTTADTLISLKVNLDGVTRRFKLPLRDLGAQVFEDKLRAFLQIPVDTATEVQRYSDSAASYVTLNPQNVSVYKQLYRAAKAKQKLKLRVVTKPVEPAQETENAPKPATVEDEREQEIQENVEPELKQETQPEPAAAPVDALSASRRTVRTSQLATTSYKSTPAKAFPTINLSGVVIDPALLPKKQESETTKSESPCPVETHKRQFTVCCNSCEGPIPDAHFHCSICDEGDFDLCQDCVNRGISCNGDGHWLIKRTIVDGEIMYSTTHIAPKPIKAAAAAERPSLGMAPLAPTPTDPQLVVGVPMSLPIRSCPQATGSSTPSPPGFSRVNFRTCNSCVQELPEKEFLHCTSCDDFDLCKTCFAKNQHGHHPSHGFIAAIPGMLFDQAVTARLAPGRNCVHDAICDGCDKYVRGVRHKCLDCPDWDYCADCIRNASFIHPGHRFVPIYEPLADRPVRFTTRNVHVGICCDGPHCTSREAASEYIAGIRYKCAVCNDLDFCANCEASPANTHNKTHPLIKFKTPVRHVSVTTTGEHEDGQRLPAMGDRAARNRASGRPTGRPHSGANGVKERIAATPVQTVVNVQPTDQPDAVKPQDVDEPKTPAQAPSVQVKEEIAMPSDALSATFVFDTVKDGSVYPLNQTFEQTWVLRNDGQVSWPAGSSVKFVGGDYMGAVDPSHPASIHEVVSASESTVCYNALSPGNQFPFTVLLRTPNRPGKVISYWRLTTPDGKKFGHKLWCDVNVQAPSKAEQTKPESPAADPVLESTENEMTESRMIIPKLVHESPATSIHESPSETTIEVETLEVETETETLAPSVDEDDFEYCGGQDDWAEESDEGFMTDEEYDILDASDEEYLSEQRKQLPKK